MKNQTKIITALILIALAIFILPKIQLFSLLNPNEYNANQDKTFLTNINYGSAEEFDDYNIGNSWISIFWDNQTLKGFGLSGIISSPPNDLCSDKSIITHTPIGLRVVKYNENERMAAICSPDGLTVITYLENYSRDAITNISQGTCMNCQSNCSSDVYTLCSNGIRYKSQKCINGSLEIVGYNIWPCLNQTDTETNRMLCIESNGTWTNSTCLCNSGYSLKDNQCNLKPNFFMQELWNINGFSIKIWMLLLAIVLLISLFLLFK